MIIIVLKRLYSQTAETLLIRTSHIPFSEILAILSKATLLAVHSVSGQCLAQALKQINLNK